jgi:DNA-binding response OmpR family regulator
MATILIVEDEPQISALVRSFIEEQGTVCFQQPLLMKLSIFSLDPKPWMPSLLTSS